MPACPRGNECSTSPPPGFGGENSPSKCPQLVELLEKLTEKCRNEPATIEQQPRQTDLLLTVVQYNILYERISVDDRRSFLQRIITTANDLLTEDQVQQQLLEESSGIDSSSVSNENVEGIPSMSASPSAIANDDGALSLDDLASEYLQDEPSPLSSNEKATPASESEESSSNVSKPPTDSILSKLLFSAVTAEPSTKSPLDLILFDSRLFSHIAADDANEIWSEDSSPFSKMLCGKTEDVICAAKKRVSTCLLDRNLYERLSRLVTLLPKQCPPPVYSQFNNYSQQPRPRMQNPRPQRPSYDNPHNTSNIRPRFNAPFHNPPYPHGASSMPRNSQHSGPMRPNNFEQYNRPPQQQQQQQHYGQGGGRGQQHHNRGRQTTTISDNNHQSYQRNPKPHSGGYKSGGRGHGPDPNHR